MMVAAFLFLTALFLAVPLVAKRLLGSGGRPTRYVRWAVLAGPVILYALFACEHAFGFGWAVIVGLSSSVTLAVVTARRSRHYRLVERMGKRLLPEDSPAALDALDAQLATWSGSGNFPSKEAAVLTLHAVRYAIEAQHFSHALKWLAAIPECEVTRNIRAPFVQYLASARLGAGDRKGAREAIATVSRPADPVEFEQSLEAMVGLLDVLEGESSAGERAVAALAGNPTASARLTWISVNAHAFAASGEREHARGALGVLRKALGDRALRRIVHHQGPASALAAAMLAGEGPYR